jgi:hypothetical protein
MYTVEFEGVTVTAAGGDADLFEITPADDKPCAIHALFLAVTSEVGDAAEEMISYKIIRGHATSGNGTATTPAPLGPIDTAAGFTAETYGTTIASAGTPVDLHSDAFNVRVPYGIILTPEIRWCVSQAQTTLVVRMMTTVADDVTMNGTLYVEELL